MKIYYDSLNTFNIVKHLQSSKLFIPIGTIEQHGPHLPLSVDIDIPCSIIEYVAEYFHGIIAPPISYGGRSLPHSGGGLSFPGTIFISGDVLIKMYRDIFLSYIKTGAKEIIIINGHYENEPYIFEALEQVRELHNKEIKIIALSWWSLISDVLITELFQNDFPGWHAEHAGIVETSIMQHIKPQSVLPVRVDNETPPLAGIYLYPADIDAISCQGVLSKTSLASALTGKIIFEHVCQRLIELINKPFGMKL